METLDWTSLEPGNSYDMDAQSATEIVLRRGCPVRAVSLRRVSVPAHSGIDVIAARVYFAPATATHHVARAILVFAEKLTARLHPLFLGRRHGLK